MVVVGLFALRGTQLREAQASGVAVSLGGEDQAGGPPPAKRRLGGKPWCWAGIYTFELCCLKRYKPCFDSRSALSYRYCCRPINASSAELSSIDAGVLQMQQGLRAIIGRVAPQFNALVYAAYVAAHRGPNKVWSIQTDPRPWSWDDDRGWTWEGSPDRDSIAAEAKILLEQSVVDLGVSLQSSGAGFAHIWRKELGGDAALMNVALLLQHSMQLLESTMKLHMPELHDLHFQVYGSVMEGLHGAAASLAAGLASATRGGPAGLAPAPAGLRPPPPRPLDVMLLVVGDYGWNAMSTVNSLVHHASSPGSVRLHAVGDQRGLESLRAALALGLRGNAGGEAVLASASFYNMFENVDFVHRLNALPFGCIWRHNFGQVAWARVLFPDLLPAEVQRVVVMDIGDIIVLGDMPAEMPKIFDAFTGDELLALWRPLGDPTSLHAGVALVDVAKLRNSTFAEDFVDLALVGLRRAPGWFCSQAEFDVLNLYSKAFPGRVHVVEDAPEWHYIPARGWSLTITQAYLPVGALGPTTWVHYCPTYLERAAWYLLRPAAIGGPVTLEEAQKLAKLAMIEHTTAARTKESAALCGRPVKLVHMPGRMKREPYVQWLLGWWSQLSGNVSNWTSAAFRTSFNDSASKWDAVGREAISDAKRTLSITHDVGLVDGIEGGLNG